MNNWCQAKLHLQLNWELHIYFSSNFDSSFNNNFKLKLSLKLFLILVSVYMSIFLRKSWKSVCRTCFYCIVLYHSIKSLAEAWEIFIWKLYFCSFCNLADFLAHCTNSYKPKSTSDNSCFIFFKVSFVFRFRVKKRIGYEVVTCITNLYTLNGTNLSWSPWQYFGIFESAISGIAFALIFVCTPVKIFGLEMTIGKG